VAADEAALKKSVANWMKVIGLITQEGPKVCSSLTNLRSDLQHTIAQKRPKRKETFLKWLS
jgi:hypothetical protein